MQPNMSSFIVCAKLKFCNGGVWGISVPNFTKLSHKLPYHLCVTYGKKNIHFPPLMRYIAKKGGQYHD